MEASGTVGPAEGLRFPLRRCSRLPHQAAIWQDWAPNGVQGMAAQHSERQQNFKVSRTIRNYEHHPDPKCDHLLHQAMADKELHGTNPLADDIHYTTTHNIRVRKEVPMAAQLENRIW